MGTQTIEELEIIIKAKVDDAIKGISLVTDTIKRKVAEATQPIKKIADETKLIATTSNSSTNEANVSFNKYQNTLKQTTAQGQLLLRKIQDIKGTLNDLSLSSMLSPQDTLEMKAELEKLTNQYNKLNNIQEKVSNTASKVSKESQKSYNSLWKAIKRGTLMILGVESAFSFFRQGMQNAINVNKDLQATQSVTQNAIGQVFVPIMEKAYNIVQYLVIGLARLIEMFTGVSILSKVTTKNINSTAKSVKSLNKQLTGIDDIDVLNSDKGSLVGGLGSDLKALQEFQDKIATIDELFKSWKIPERVEEIKKAWNKHIQPILDFMWQHPELLTTFFGIFLTGKLLSSINKVIGSSSAGTGLLGMNNLLLGLGSVLTTGIIVKKIIEENKELKADMDYGFSDEGRKVITDFYSGIGAGIEQAKKDGTIQKQADDMYSSILTALDTAGTQITASKQLSSGGTGLWNALWNPDQFNKAHNNIAKVADEFKVLMKDSRTFLENTTLTEEQYGQLLSKVRTQTEYLEKNLDTYIEGTDEWNRTNEAIQEGNRLIRILKQDYLGIPTIQESLNKKIENAKVVASNTFSNITTGFSGVISKASQKLGELTGKSYFFKFASQTDNLTSGVRKAMDNVNSSIRSIFDKDYRIKMTGDSSELERTTTNTLRKIVDKMHSTFKIFNTVSSSIGIKELSGGVNSWFANAKNILKFANGNVATSPTLGIFGEYSGAKSNPEITAPQSILKQTFREELNNNSVNNSSERITINLGTETIFDKFIDYVNNLYSNGVQVFKES